MYIVGIVIVVGSKIRDDLILVPLLDNYLIVADMYQRNIYQVSLATSEVSAVFSVAPFSSNSVANYTALALDPITQTVYWTDITARLIGKTTLGGVDQIIFSDKASTYDVNLSMSSSLFLYVRTCCC